MDQKGGLDSIKMTNTRMQTLLPPCEDAIPGKLVLKQKKEEQGLVASLKARLIAQGYIQKDIVDYDKMFAPVKAVDVLLPIV